jgi:thioredoxin 1
MFEELIAYMQEHPLYFLGVVYFLFIVYQKMQPFPDENEGPKNVKDLAEWEALLQSAGDKAVVCDFYATWCPPCKTAAPLFHKLSEEPQYAQGVIFRKCNVDTAKSVAQACRISSMPTFKVFKGGAEVHSMSGYNENQLRGFIANAMPAGGDKKAAPAVAAVAASKKD